MVVLWLLMTRLPVPVTPPLTVVLATVPAAKVSTVKLALFKVIEPTTIPDPAPFALMTQLPLVGVLTVTLTALKFCPPVRVAPVEPVPPSVTPPVPRELTLFWPFTVPFLMMMPPVQELLMPASASVSVLLSLVRVLAPPDSEMTPERVIVELALPLARLTAKLSLRVIGAEMVVAPVPTAERIRLAPPLLTSKAREPLVPAASVSVCVPLLSPMVSEPTVIAWLRLTVWLAERLTLMFATSAKALGNPEVQLF